MLIKVGGQRSSNVYLLWTHHEWLGLYEGFEHTYETMGVSFDKLVL